MIQLPFRRLRRAGRDPTIRALYGMIVTQARSAAFYRDLGVPDSVQGRIEMIMLHLALMLRRLRQDGATTRTLQQDLFDLFCQDMDDNFREMGVGDLSVPKEMQRVAEAFYGRARVYDAALDAADRDALVRAVARNVHGVAEHPGAAALAAYVIQAAWTLAAAPVAAMLRSEADFPEPDTTPDATGRPQPAPETD